MAERPSQKALAELVSEAQETVEALDADLLRLGGGRAGGEPDPEALNAVFRSAHSLKGLASMFGLERMARLAHALEDKLDDVRMGRQALDAPTLDLLLAAPALFERIIAEESGKRPAESAEDAAALAERLRARAPAAPAGADRLSALDLDAGLLRLLTEYEEHRLRASVDRGLHLYRARARFDIETFDTALEGLKGRLREAGEVVCTLPSSDPNDRASITFEVLLASAQAPDRIQGLAGSAAAVEEIGPRAGAGPPLPPPAARGPHPRGEGERGSGPGAAPAVARAPASQADASLRSPSQAVRVDIQKLDELMNVVGELALLRTSVARLAERLFAGEEADPIARELVRDAGGLERRIAELQGGILEVRMVPLGQVFEKLGRMVRKLTREEGKEVDFQVEGASVKLDKLIAEDLSDPLMHLIRNAVDHGIEGPDARRAAGKDPVGRVRLSAEQKGSHVLVVVEDDGSGIDERRIREVAVQRGLLSAESAAHLSIREALNLIFLPGFSTSRRVTALSGRGVGMDVVRNNVAARSGIIDFTTERGRGTRFEITLPVTLAVIRALLVEVSGRTYAVPLNSVLEILEVSPAEIRTVETREVVTLRGSPLPLVRLDRLFGLPPPVPGGPLFAVVTGLAQQRLGVVVDGLHGEQDVVVKPLGRSSAGLRGIAGVTDLGGRRTVLVLDVGAIIEEVAGGERLAEAAG